MSPTRIVVAVTVAAFACRGAEKVTLPEEVVLRTVAIDSVTPVMERGTRDTLVASTVDREGHAVTVPVVWRSSNERVAIFERGGALVAVDTGTTAVVASSLGVVSTPVNVRVVWLGPARIAAGTFARKNAVSPGVTLSDSLRVIVTNIYGTPVPGTKVRFTVTEGGGTVSSATVTTGNNGMAAVQWTLGPAIGRNTLTAAVLRGDDSLNPLVKDNLVSFALNSYNALTTQAGDGQTGQIGSDLPVVPSITLTDSLGAPRPGLPIVFTAFSNGRVVTPVVSTDANGVASPGRWTLGDIPGDQILEARVEDARVQLHATGTGTPVYYMPARVVIGGFSSCALESDNSVKCWGQTPQNGSGDTLSFATPKSVKGSLTVDALVGSQTHYCGVTSSGEAWCWGRNALVDTTGLTPGTTSTPTRMPSSIVWAQVAPGFAHNCGLNATQIAYCWGDNSSGQLGDQSTTPRRNPTAVSGGFKFKQLSSATSHSCGLALDGSAFCWGSNQFGQLGDGTGVGRATPTVVGGGQLYQSIGAAETGTCGLNTQGQAYCWGTWADGLHLSPVAYSPSLTFVSLTVGGAHACALTADGTAYCWGSNQWGQLGDSTTTSRNAPTAVGGGFRFQQLSAGYVHTCGLTTQGTVACWGRNTVGELGENGSGFRTTPRRLLLSVTP